MTLTPAGPEAMLKLLAGVTRFSWIRLPGSSTLLPAVREDGEWIEYADAVAALTTSAGHASETPGSEHEALAVTKAHLREHWLASIVCDHEAKTDVAVCSCSQWKDEPHPSVGAAVDAWIDHVFDTLPATRTPQTPMVEHEPEEQTLEFWLRGVMAKIYNRGHSGLELDCPLCQAYIATDRLLAWETGGAPSDEVRSWDRRIAAPAPQTPMVVANPTVTENVMVGAEPMGAVAVEAIIEGLRGLKQYNSPAVMNAINFLHRLPVSPPVGAEPMEAVRDAALREAADLVRTFTPVRPAFETEDEGGIKWPHPAQQQPIYSPGKLADAILALGRSSPLDRASVTVKALKALELGLDLISDKKGWGTYPRMEGVDIYQDADDFKKAAETAIAALKASP